MAAYVDGLSDFLRHFVRLYDSWFELRDRRVDNWPLMSSCLPTLLLAAVYLSVVYHGPRIMRDRAPFHLRTPLIVYNIAVAALNLYIGIEAAIVVVGEKYNWFCQPVDYSFSPPALRLASALWFYYMSKLLEFTDTLFFILRKKNSQLTFLHVYHHVTMFMLWWIGARWVAGGSGAMGAMVNSFVHVIMYTYYGLSALGPSIQPYLWWKHYLTLLQMMQFCLNFGMGCLALKNGCAFPLWMQYANLAYMISFMVLFSRFYFSTYKRKSVISAVKTSKKPPHKNGISNGHVTDKKFN